MKTQRIIPIVVAFSLLAGPAAADKQVPPPAGPPKNFKLPATVDFQLDNGMRVTLVPYGTVPKVAVRLVVRTGAIDTAADQIWLPDLLADLMLEGAGDRTASQLATAAATMGGEVDTAVGDDTTDIRGSSLSEFAPAMVALVADVARRPKLPEDQLKRLKTDMLRNLSMALSRQQTLAGARFAELMFPNHPYGRTLPTPEMVSGYTLEQLRDFYDKNFGAARAHLYVAGQFDRAAVEKAVRDGFGDWKAGSPFTENPPKMGRVARRTIHLIDRPKAVQSTLYVGAVTTDPSGPDWIPLSVTSTLLGGAFTSRLTTNLREDKGYTYSPHGYLADYYRAAYWVEVADVTTKVTGPSLEEIFGELSRLRKKAPSQDELRGIQNYLAGVFVLRNSSRGGVIRQLEFVDMHGLGRDYLRTYVDRVMTVTPEQIRQMAKKYLDPAHMLVVVAGDRAAIRKQLAKFGKVVK